MAERQLCARLRGLQGGLCPPGAHSVAEVEGSRQEHRRTATHDDRDPGPGGPAGAQPRERWGGVGQCDGNRDAGLKLRAVREEQERSWIVA